MNAHRIDQTAHEGQAGSHGPLFEQYDADKDFSESINDCYRDVRKRVAKGGRLGRVAR